MSRPISSYSVRLGVALCLGLLAAPPSTPADEQFTALKVGSEVYSNVTVTTVTATDIYFSHARGMGSAKLKNLDPKLQRHFGFDPVKAGEAEKLRVQANVQFREELASRPVASPGSQPTDAEIDDDGNLVVPKLFARSFMGQRPPQIIAMEWLTPPPEVEGKFVLVVIWTSWADACRKVVPHLNELQAKYKDRLVIVAISNETLENLRKQTSLQLDFTVGTDTEARTMNMLEVQGIPHSILIDPKGTVRFEGVPVYLTEKGLGRLMDRYSN